MGGAEGLVGPAQLVVGGGRLVAFRVVEPESAQFGLALSQRAAEIVAFGEGCLQPIIGTPQARLGFGEVGAAIVERLPSPGQLGLQIHAGTPQPIAFASYRFQFAGELTLACFKGRERLLAVSQPSSQVSARRSTVAFGFSAPVRGPLPRSQALAQALGGH